MELSGKFKVLSIKSKTSAVLFKDFKVGDEFILRYNLNGWYGSAPTIDIISTKGKHSNTANQLNNNLSNFELEQLG